MLVLKDYMIIQRLNSQKCLFEKKQTPESKILKNKMEENDNY